MGLRAPILSEFDPPQESEGSVDPLSLQRIYERLADRILPAVTVRMSRVRFLTAIAVAAHVCRDYEDDDLAADDLTPPWLLFEWFVVEAFARSLDDDTPRGIPGMMKVKAALRNGRHVGAASYLKTPKIFGYTGVYKRLAVALRIVTDGLRLDDRGYRLVREWERDQEMQGFFDGREGPGARFRDEIREALRDGLAKGRTVHRKGPFWDELATKFHPDHAGPREAAAIRDALLSGDHVDPSHLEGARMTRELLEALVRKPFDFASEDEADYLRTISPASSAELRVRLQAIDDYESLCRPITDAFDFVRHLSTREGRAPIGADEFSECKEASGIVGAVASGASRVRDNRSLLEWEPDVLGLVSRYGDVKTAADLFRRVLEHHEHAQREKPPEGKRPWIERVRQDRVVIRAAYAFPDPPVDRREYVHVYRVPSVSRFLGDLGRAA